MNGERLSMNLSPEEKQRLGARAKAQGVPITDRVRKALRLLDKIEDQPEGTKVLLHRPDDDSPTELVLL